MKQLFSLRATGWWLSALALCISRLGAAQPTGCTQNDPGGNPPANGLYAEYFAGYFNDDQSFFTSHAPGLTRVDAQLNFPLDNSWGTLVPPAQNTAADPELFSARYRGSLYVAVAGNYTFYLSSDDASYLWLGNAAQALPAQTSQATINNGGLHGVQERSATVFLTAGLHSVLIHYGEDLYGNVLIWEWESAAAGIARQVVPSNVLCTSFQNQLQIPQSISYSPSVGRTSASIPLSSPTPTVDDGGSPVTQFAIANAAALPAGITINAATGVLSLDATVPAGSYAVSVAVTNANGTSVFGNAFTFQVAPPPPVGCSGLDAGGNAATSGLYAEYYSGYFNNDQTFFASLTPGLARVEPQVNFAGTSSWGNLLPTASGGTNDPDNFSARYRGAIRVPVTGNYTFYLTSDDASYMWLSNNALPSPALTSKAFIDNGGLHPAQERSATVFLTAGLHNVLIHYGESGGGNSLTLEWASAAAGIARQPVPNAVLCSVVQPQRFPPTSLSYSPGSVSAVAGTATVSGTPSATSSLPLMGFAITNDVDLPAGITINSATGVLAADATVPQGTYEVNVAAYNSDGATTFSSAFDFVITPPPPPGCAGTDPGGQPVAAGFYAEYYAGYFDDEPNNQNYFTANTPAFRRVEPQLNFPDTDTWGELTPAASGTTANPDRFSARFKGSFRVPVTGSYTFYLTSDDASYMWLDNAALDTPPVTALATIRNGMGHPPTTVTATVTLAEGLHNILVHYGEFTGGNMLTLEWSSTDAGIARQIIPAAALCSAPQAPRPLPVSLLWFRAKDVAGIVELTWETAQERSNDYFAIERSADGRAYATVARIAGAGSTDVRRSYRALDPRPLPGLSYYRLRQVDVDGTFSLSEPVAVQRTALKAGEPVATVHPNPSGGRFVVKLQQAAGAGTRLELLDLRGRVLLTEPVAEGEQEHLVEARRVSAGVYLLRVSSPAGSSVIRVVIE